MQTCSELCSGMDGSGSGYGGGIRMRVQAELEDLT